MANLQEQIDDARLQVHTDAYPMSIGELVNLYDDDELDIHPEFQRLYRWTDEQKSKLIESIFLGIPLPSIFVAQRKDGVWDVVDGLQRISTILSFVGKLKDENDKVLPPLMLNATKYLPQMAGMFWDNEDSNKVISVEVKRLFKREKIDIKIIKRESEGDTKFELFQRLNTGGSKLSDQEVRNCMLLMIDRDAFLWLDDLSKNESFRSCTPVSSKQKEECYLNELVLRFLIQRDNSEDLRKEHSDVAPYLNDELNRLFKKDSGFNFEVEKQIFEKTFDILSEALGENSFKKYNHGKNKYEGAISIPVFEALVPSVSKILEREIYSRDHIISLIQNKTMELTLNPKFFHVMEKQVRPIDRMTKMESLGYEVFK